MSTQRPTRRFTGTKSGNWLHVGIVFTWHKWKSIAQKLQRWATMAFDRMYLLLFLLRMASRGWRTYHLVVARQYIESWWCGREISRNVLTSRNGRQLSWIIFFWCPQSRLLVLEDCVKEDHINEVPLYLGHSKEVLSTCSPFLYQKTRNLCSQPKTQNLCTCIVGLLHLF